MCGGGSIPDRAVPISESDKIVAAIKKCNNGENLTYVRNPTASHGNLERIFHSDKFYDWLFSQIRTSPIKETKELSTDEDKVQL